MGKCNATCQDLQAAERITRATSRFIASVASDGAPKGTVERQSKMNIKHSTFPKFFLCSWLYIVHTFKIAPPPKKKDEMMIKSELDDGLTLCKLSSLPRTNCLTCLPRWVSNFLLLNLNWGTYSKDNVTYILYLYTGDCNVRIVREIFQRGGGKARIINKTAHTEYNRGESWSRRVFSL